MIRFAFPHTQAPTAGLVIEPGPSHPAQDLKGYKLEVAYAAFLAIYSRTAEDKFQNVFHLPANDGRDRTPDGPSAQLAALLSLVVANDKTIVSPRGLRTDELLWCTGELIVGTGHRVTLRAVGGLEAKIRAFRHAVRRGEARYFLLPRESFDRLPKSFEPDVDAARLDQFIERLASVENRDDDRAVLILLDGDDVEKLARTLSGRSTARSRVFYLLALGALGIAVTCGVQASGSAPVHTPDTVSSRDRGASTSHQLPPTSAGCPLDDEHRRLASVPSHYPVGSLEESWGNLAIGPSVLSYSAGQDGQFLYHQTITCSRLRPDGIIDLFEVNQYGFRPCEAARAEDNVVIHCSLSGSRQYYIGKLRGPYVFANEWYSSSIHGPFRRTGGARWSPRSATLPTRCSSRNWRLGAEPWGDIDSLAVLSAVCERYSSLSFCDRPRARVLCSLAISGEAANTHTELLRVEVEAPRWDGVTMIRRWAHRDRSGFPGVELARCQSTQQCEFREAGLAGFPGPQLTVEIQSRSHDLFVYGTGQGSLHNSAYYSPPPALELATEADCYRGNSASGQREH